MLNKTIKLLMELLTQSIIQLKIPFGVAAAVKQPEVRPSFLRYKSDTSIIEIRQN